MARHWIKQFKFGGESSSDPEADSVIDARTPSRITKLAQKLITLAKNPKLNLKNSPPYLQGILVDDIELINSIFKRNSLESLRANEYLNTFIECFLRQYKKTSKLFKEAKERMEEESSPWRRELSKITLVFSHMLAELKTFFKDGVWVPDFRIVKVEAREFWEKSFSRRHDALCFTHM